MSALGEKHGAGTAIQESNSHGSDDSQEISGKEDIEKIENVDVEAAHGDEPPVVWHWRQLIVTTSLAVVYVGTILPAPRF